MAKKKSGLSKDKMNKYASLIAKREGLKSQVKIGDIREILKVFFEILMEETKQELAQIGAGPKK